MIGIIAASLVLRLGLAFTSVVSCDVWDFFLHTFSFLSDPLNMYRKTAEDMELLWRDPSTSIVYLWRPAGSYSYPPLWVMILSLLFLAVREPYADPAMRYVFLRAFACAEKIPIILADLMIGCMLYRRLRSGRRGATAACLYLFSFVPIFEAGIFGQFDSIAAMFLSASLLTIEGGKPRLAGLFAGLALMTKQWALFAVVPMFFYLLGRAKGKAVDYLVAAFGICLLFSAPFLQNPECAQAYLRRVWMYGFSPELFRDWQAGLTTWMHNHVAGYYLVSILALDAAGLGYGEFSWVVWVGRIVQLGLLTVCAREAFRGRLDANGTVLLGSLTFLTTSWIVHAQYTIFVIPFFILDVMQRRRSLRWISITFLPSVIPIFAHVGKYKVPTFYEDAAVFISNLMGIPVGFRQWTLGYLLIASTGYVYVSTLTIYLLRTLMSRPVTDGKAG